VIETHGLRKVYARARAAAVDSLDLSVPRGQIFGFLGPNGAGKTTTIGMLLGNVRPSGGTGTLLGRPLGDREARRRVGYLPEKFQFHEFLTAAEFLDIHGRLYGMTAAARRRRIPEVLELAGIAHRANDRLRDFSKGMQQRAGLAQAILHEPDLVILDEPTSALDPLGRRAVRDLILYVRGRGATVLLNSHLLSEVERTCERVAIIRQGRVVRQGTVEEITTPFSQVVVELESNRSPGPEALAAAAAPLGAVVEPFTGESANGGATVRLRVTLPGGDADIPDLVHAVVGAGGRIRSVVPLRESLEDAFVRLMEENAPGPPEAAP
jgi:ABC-type multidrug transport system, ATPase component